MTFGLSDLIAVLLLLPFSHRCVLLSVQINFLLSSIDHFVRRFEASQVSIAVSSRSYGGDHFTIEIFLASLQMSFEFC